MIVFYTGIGANKNGKHTKEEFLKIMLTTFTKTDAYYKLYGSSHDPKKLKKFTFVQWIKWSGAEIKKM